MRNILFILTVLGIIACRPHNHNHDSHSHSVVNHDHKSANEHMHNRPFDELVAAFESPERDAYQQPDLVLNQFESFTDKKVMDLGAGTGYFSFRIAKKGAHVIAADVDQRFLNLIQDRIIKEKYPVVEPRLIPTSSPKLSKEEVDMVWVVNTYHHIENRTEYFSEVRDGLKPNGELVIIDFFKEKDTPGPPKEVKLSADTIKNELLSAGFSTITIDNDLLEFQYIIRAKK